MGCVGGKPKASTERKNTNADIEEDLANKGKFEDYQFKKLLGHGKYGRVLLGKSSVDDKMVAIKVISKTDPAVTLCQVMKEIEILSQVDHPNIVKYLKHFQTDKYLYIVMEYCEGGDLFGKIVEKEKFNETEAANAMGEILRAVNHCHHLGLIHRDLKPENIMCTKKGQIKIIDFGLSMLEKGFSFERVAGTAFYIAPEIIKEEIFTKACDIWSLGIILHILLSGYIPIGGTSQEDIFTHIREYPGPSFSGESWKGVSKEAKDLVKRMLEPDHTKRITAAEALKHPWFNNTQDAHSETNPGIMSALKKYSKYSKLKKKALTLLVQNLNETDIQKLQTLFLGIDKEQTGLITCADLQICLKQEGHEMTAEELESLTRKVNYEGEAVINYTDFLAATLATQHFLTEERLWSLFRAMDIEKKGWITELNLKALLAKRKRVLSTEIELIMRDTDINHDGKITYEDFKGIFINDLQLEITRKDL